MNKSKLHKWILSILFVIISILNFIRIDSTSHSVSDSLKPFILKLLAFVLILFLFYRILNRTLHIK